MENIKEYILDKNSMLYLEPRFILNEDFKQEAGKLKMVQKDIKLKLFEKI